MFRRIIGFLEVKQLIYPNYGVWGCYKRDGASIENCPFGSTNRIKGSGASNFWFLKELVGRNDNFSFVFLIVVTGSLLKFIYYFIISTYSVEVDFNSKCIIN